MQAAELVPEIAAPIASGSSPPAAAQGEPGREAAARPTSSARTWVLVGEAVVAAAGLGIGLGYLSAAGSAQTEIDDINARIDALSGGMGCATSSSGSPALKGQCDNLATALSDHRRDTSLAIAGFAGAGVGAAAFVATLIFWKTSPRDQTSVVVAPALVRGGGGVSLGWAY
jgi:hypothetical protein